MRGLVLFAILIVSAKSEDAVKNAVDKSIDSMTAAMEKIWGDETLRTDLVNIGVLAENAMSKEIECFEKDAEAFDDATKALWKQIQDIFEKHTDPVTHICMTWHAIQEILADQALVKAIGENEQFLNAVSHAGQCLMDDLKAGTDEIEKFSEDLVNNLVGEQTVAPGPPPPLPMLRRPQW